MIKVVCWHDQENDRWNATLVNSTGRSEAEMRELFVQGYNRATGESRSEADFDFVQL